MALNTIARTLVEILLDSNNELTYIYINMSTLKLDVKNVLGTVTAEQIQALHPEAVAALDKVNNGTGAGADFLGWVNLPENTTDALVADIEATAAKMRELCDYVVAVGIGGSYLGAKAVIEALSDSFAMLLSLIHI